MPTDITPTELHTRMQAQPDLDLIDVRTTMEWRGGHAVGARHVPLSGLDPAKVLAERRGKPDDPLYIICASGGRSASACAAFAQAGFPHAVNVVGGTSAWIRAGLPTKREAGGLPSGALRTAGIYAVTALVMLLLMPCSPLAIWGTAWCPITPAAAISGQRPPAAEGIDFARDVVAASANTPVLVDFTAGWCPPCQRLAPELEALASARDSSLAIVKIDVDAHRPIASAQGVASIPDLRLWHRGKEVARNTGFMTTAELGAWIDRSLPD